MKLENLRRLAARPGLVLASGSPRRRRILTEAGIPFDVIIPDIEEIHPPDISPETLAIDLAEQKVRSIVSGDRQVYLSCDTMVALDGKFLDKPKDADDARRILKTLSGRTHSVFTGLVLFDSRNGNYFRGVEESRVSFRRLEDKSIDDYIATGEPMDKAGAYGIQGMGGFLVDSIEGNIDNVIGLPLTELEHLAGQLLDAYGG